VNIWGTATGEDHRTIVTDHDEVTFVAFSPDGTRLVTSSGLDSSPVTLWDTVTGQLRCSILTGHDRVASVAIAPDSTWLATAGWQTVKGMFDETVQLWEAETGEHLTTLRSESRVLSVAISPDGTWLAAGERGGSVRIWDLVGT
jgi:WD40 repeat protein